MTHDFYQMGEKDARGGRETSTSYVTFHPCSGSPEHATHSPQRPHPAKLKMVRSYPRAQRALCSCCADYSSTMCTPGRRQAFFQPLLFPPLVGWVVLRPKNQRRRKKLNPEKHVKAGVEWSNLPSFRVVPRDWIPCGREQQQETAKAELETGLDLHHQVSLESPESPEA